MVRVLFREGDIADVAADTVSFDAGEAVFWRGDAEIARHPLTDMGGFQLGAVPVEPSRPDPAHVAAQIRAHFPRYTEHWDDAEDERLLQLADEGRTTFEIAGLLGRQVSAVRARLDSLSVDD